MRARHRPFAIGSDGMHGGKGWNVRRGHARGFKNKTTNQSELPDFLTMSGFISRRA